MVSLTLHDGTEYHFKISGLDVVAVGFKQATMVGSVYNLNTSKIEDFSGKYIKAKAAITVGGGVGASSLRNDKGVVINLTGTSAGINVQLSVSSISLLYRVLYTCVQYPITGFCLMILAA